MVCQYTHHMSWGNFSAPPTQYRRRDTCRQLHFARLVYSGRGVIMLFHFPIWPPHGLHHGGTMETPCQKHRLVSCGSARRGWGSTGKGNPRSGLGGKRCQTMQKSGAEMESDRVAHRQFVFRVGGGACRACWFGGGGCQLFGEIIQLFLPIVSLGEPTIRNGRQAVQKNWAEKLLSLHDEDFAA